jgi:hypothetical protein
MRRATVLTISAFLAMTSGAWAKAGVEFDKFTETIRPGQSISFTAMTYRPRPNAQDELQPITDRRPLLTFRSGSGRVVRVRTAATDLNGFAHGTVAFPDKGPWTTEMKVAGVVTVPAEHAATFVVGGGLTHTVPSADEEAATTTAGDRGDGLPWLPILSGAIASAFLVLTMRRRSHWGAA